MFRKSGFLAIALSVAPALTPANAFAMRSFASFHPAIGGSQGGGGSANRTFAAHSVTPSSLAPRSLATQSPASHSFVSQSFHSIATRGLASANTSHVMASHVPSNFSTTPVFHDGPLASLQNGATN